MNRIKEELFEYYIDKGYDMFKAGELSNNSIVWFDKRYNHYELYSNDGEFIKICRID